MSRYIFKHKDILNSPIFHRPRSPSSHSPSSDFDSDEPLYTTKTSKSYLHRQTTTLISNKDHVAVGEILWKDKVIRVGASASSMSDMSGARSTNEIKTKPRKVFNRHWHRIWQWDSASPQYSTTFSKNQWNVTETTTGALHATMTPFKLHGFTSTIEPAEITFTEDYIQAKENSELLHANSDPEADIIFLILVLLRMETRRLDAKKRAFMDDLSGGFAAAVGTVG